MLWVASDPDNRAALSFLNGALEQALSRGREKEVRLLRSVRAEVLFEMELAEGEEVLR